jgi:hypothetical protein
MNQIPLKDVKWTTFFAGFIKQGVLHFQETLEILGSVQRVISLSLPMVVCFVSPLIPQMAQILQKALT